MSPHDPPAVAVDAHDTHAHDEEDASEPRTPLWLPLLGGVLFLVTLMVVVATRPPGKTAEELSKEAESAAQQRTGNQKAAEPEPAAPTPPAPAPRPAAPAPGMPPAGCGG